MHSSYTPDRHSDYNKSKLFVLSVIALVTAGVAFSIRASIADDLKTAFFDRLDPLNSAGMIGAVLGVAFLGFAFAIAIGSPLLDSIGMGRVLGIASGCFIAGTLTVLFAEKLAGAFSIYRVIWLGMALSGVALGLGGNDYQSSCRDTVSRRQDPPVERAARMVASGSNHWRPAGPRDRTNMPSAGRRSRPSSSFQPSSSA